MANKSKVDELKHVQAHVSRLQAEWREEHLILQFLIAAGYVSEDKVNLARELARELTRI